MSLTSRPNGPRDTVEEFWNKRILRECRRRAPQASVEQFLVRLGKLLGTSGKMYPMTSGRVALAEFLKNACRRGGKNTVLMCSFNCEAVSGAVLDAGLKPETYDLSDKTGSFDWALVAAQLRDDHHAIVVPHLFGVPTDFRPLLDAARSRDTLVIEDCAHTLGGKIGDACAGTLGDAAIFSFNFDKPISLGGGGALLVNRRDLEIATPDLSISIEEEWKEVLHAGRYLRERRSHLQAPNLFQRVCRRLFPRVFAGNDLRPAKGFGQLRAALGCWQLDRYDFVRRQRNQNAVALSTGPLWNSWHVGADVVPAWLKQKVIPVKPMGVYTLASQLQALGFRVGAFNWPKTLDGVLSLPERENAYYVATYGLDVPIHQEMTTDELATISRALCALAPT